MSDWQDDLSEELKTDATLRNFETPEAAYQGLIDLKAKQGNMIRLSSEDASDDERTANRDKIMKVHDDLMLRPDFTDEAATKDYLTYLGVPAEAADYNIKDTELPAEWMDVLRADALKEELTPRQFQKRLDNLTEQYSAQNDELSVARQENDTELKTAWGAAFDGRMKQVEWVKNEFFAEFGELNELNNIAIQGLYKVAQALQGKGAQAHSQPNAPQAQFTPEEAHSRVTELRKKIIENKVPSDKDKLTKRMIEMQKLTNPELYARDATNSGGV